MAQDLNKTVDSTEENLTEKQLKFGFWFTSNKPKLYIWFIICFIIFDVILGGYNLYRWGDYLFFGYWNDQKLLVAIAQPLSNAKALREYLSPKPIVMEGSAVFPSGDKIDAVAWIRNPNTKYIAYFNYDFVVGGIRTDVRRGFLLPGEAKTVAELGIKAGGVADAGVEIKNFDWQRINAHEIKNIPLYMNDRLNITSSDFKFTSSYNLNLTESRINFKVQNNTFFNFWQADFWVILKTGETPVGVERLALDRFMAGENREVEVSISPNITPNNIQLVPDINIFESKAFFK